MLIERVAATPCDRLSHISHVHAFDPCTTVGLYNFGGQVGSYMGIGLLQFLGGVEPPR